MRHLEGLDTRTNGNKVREQWSEIANNIEGFEREKSANEIELIREADDKTSRILGEYGIEPHTITVEKIHILDSAKYPGGHAFMSPASGEAFVCEENDPERFLRKIIHEMFHLKGSNSLPEPLTEAIVERLTCQAKNLNSNEQEGSSVFSGVYSYPNLRVLLDELLGAIKRKAAEGVTNDRHSFSFFAKAHLTGDINYIDFLNNLFGPSTLETLRKLDTEDALRDFIQKLK